MMKRLKIRRGLKADLPVLAEGEMGLCTDTRQTYIGTNTGNNLQNVMESVVFVSKYKPADFDDLPDAVSSLSATGGTIVLDNIALGDTGYTSPGTITTDNISIVGTAYPVLDFANEAIGNACAVINGEMIIAANNFSADRVFFKSLVAGNNLVVNSTTKYNCILTNLAFLGHARNSLYHCLLVENTESVIIGNIQSCRNVWGVALKDSNVQLTGLRAKNHNNGGLIVKADATKTVQNATCTNIYSESTPDGSGDNYGALYVQNYQESSFLKNVTITNFRLVNQYLYISNINTSTTLGLDNINISNGIITGDGASGSYNILFASQPNTGLIKLSNIVGTGAGSYGIRDASKVFSNVIMTNCQFDKVIDCNFNISDGGFGSQFKKSGVVHNTSTQVFSYTYDSPSFTQIDVSIGFQSASVIAAGKYSICTGYSTGNSSKTHLQGYGITDLILGVAINTGTKTVTVSATQTNTSSETGTLYFSIIPRIIGGRTVITPL